MSRLVRPRALLWTAVTAYAAGFGALSILRHRAFSTGRFDLGNMTQAVWATAHGRPLEVTSLQGEQFVRLGAHFDPVLALLAPLWWLWPSPTMLLAVQAAAIALGAPAVFLLARKHLGSERAALGFALAYLLSPALQWMTLSEFHPVALATPLLLWALWFLDEGRLVPFAVAAALASMGKEHVPLAVAALGVWYALARGRPRAGATVAAAGLALTVFVVAVVIPAFSPEGASSFYGRYDAVGGSPGGIVRTALTEPVTVLRALVDGHGPAYVFQLLLPLAALSVLAPLLALVALPELALNLLSSTPTQTSIHFHYSAVAIAALTGAAVLGAARVARGRETVALRLALVVVALSLGANYALGAIPVWRAFPGGEQLGTTSARVNAHDRVAARAVALVPDDDVVSASNSMGAHLSERRRILSFPILRDAGWVAVDETQPGYLDRIAPEPYAIAIARLRRDPAWRLVFQEDGVLVFRRTS